MSMTGVKSDTYTMRKLPLWGEGGLREHPLNFEWPNPEVFDQMKSSAKVTGMTFKAHDGGDSDIAWVQVHMSDGTSSPVFKTSASWFRNEKMVAFPDDRRVCSVTASEQHGRCVYAIQFKDSQGEVIDEYDPHRVSSRAGGRSSKELSDNEEIIGVYGVNSPHYHRYFLAFGFIVQTKQI